jgi:hypothetical protein
MRSGGEWCEHEDKRGQGQRNQTHTGTLARETSQITFMPAKDADKQPDMK